MKKSLLLTSAALLISPAPTSQPDCMSQVNARSEREPLFKDIILARASSSARHAGKARVVRGNQQVPLRVKQDHLAGPERGHGIKAVAQLG